MSCQAQFSDSSPEVIIYGGSFDPPHNGHAQMIGAALNRFSEADVVVVPAYAPAVGGQGLKSVAASFSQRLDMATLAFANLAPSRVKISAIEQTLTVPSYTLNTLRFFAGQYDKKRLALLLGQDQFEAFPKWHAPKAILEIADLIVIPRLSKYQGRGPELTEITHQVAHELGSTLQWNSVKDRATTEFGTNFYLLSTQVCPAVSSLIRQQIKSGEQTPTDWLPDSVQQFINKHQLYRHSED